MAFASVFLVVLGSYAWLLFIRPLKQLDECMGALRRLSALDRVWSPAHIHKRASHVFLAVQRAWTEREQNLARECMRVRLLEEHKAKTDRMLHKHERNVVGDIRIQSVQVIGLRESSERSRNHLWILFKAQLMDYIIDDRTGEVLRGDQVLPRQLEELWLFVLEQGDWVVDHINQTPNDFSEAAAMCVTESV